MTTENEVYNLVQTYVKRKYFISTAHRKASTLEEMWYFETIVWEWEHEKRKVGKMLDSMDSGSIEEAALVNHFEEVKKYAGEVL